MSNITATISDQHGVAKFTFKGKYGTTTFTITPDGFGLLVSVAVEDKNGKPIETQIGFACEDKLTAHVDAL